MAPELGIIEGFYGPLWTWEERRQLVSRLAPAGYGFYLYAPKADPSLRENWRQPLPSEHRAELADFAAYCGSAGMRFGVGLSPIGALEPFDDACQQALQDRLGDLDGLGIRDLAILFDDVRCDLPDLAGRQVELVHWAHQHSSAERLILCPSYYADDPALDRMFGPRPRQYLQQLGAALDPAIDIFWAGEEVCSRELSPGHLNDVARRLQRRPFLWDNYPVNDGPQMCRHLHLRGFTGRPASLAPAVSAHGINPALQPTLSCIAALTLAERYRQGDDFCYLEATRRAMTAVLGETLAERVWEDLPLLQDSGLDRLGADRTRLRQRYADIDHSGAAEIVRWLDGAYGQG